MQQPVLWVGAGLGLALLSSGCLLFEESTGPADAGHDVGEVEPVLDAQLSPEIDVAAAEVADIGASDTGPVPDGDAVADVLDVSADAEADGDDDSESSAEEVVDSPPPTTLFRDANEELSLPHLMSSTVSAADVDGDGWTDLLVGGRLGVEDSVTDVFLNAGGESLVAMGLADRIADGPALLSDVVSTSIVDLDRDGRMDLLLGGFEAARLQVLFQRSDGDFDSVIVYETEQHPGAKLMAIETADLDGNGLMDLYLGIKWPSMKLAPWQKTHANALLLAVGARSWLDFSGEIEAFNPCGRRQTFSAQMIPRATFEQVGLLHAVNDLARNCLWEVTPGLPKPVFDEIDDPDMLLTFTPFSMGADWYFEGESGDVVMLSVEVTKHLLFAVRDGELADETDRLELTNKDYVGWGGLFVDADNDGDEDLVIASGRSYFEDEDVAYSAQWLPLGEPAYTSRLLYWQQQPDGTFAHDNAIAGDRFDEETGEFFGVTVADLNQDGCLDLVATMREMPHRGPFDTMGPNVWTYEADSWSYDGPGVRVLLNNCMHPENHWVALDVPDRPGMTVALTLADGTRRYRTVKGNVGVASRSGGGRVHFGLGPESTAVSAELYGADGELVASVTTVPLDSVTKLKP